MNKNYKYTAGICCYLVSWLGKNMYIYTAYIYWSHMPFIFVAIIKLSSKYNLMFCWLGYHLTCDISISLEIWRNFFCSHSNSIIKVVTTKFCTWHGSIAVVACAKVYRDMMDRNEITAKWNSLWIWILNRITSDMDPRWGHIVVLMVICSFELLWVIL